jgi:hypothetical protein
MRIYYNRGFTQVPYDVSFVRTSKTLRWTSTEKFKPNGIYPFHEAIMETIQSKFPTAAVTCRKSGNIRIRFDSEADEALFLLIVDDLRVDIDVDSI